MSVNYEKPRVVAKKCAPRHCRAVGFPIRTYTCVNVWDHRLSCGHDVRSLDPEPPAHCPVCGAVRVDDSGVYVSHASTMEVGS